MDRKLQILIVSCDDWTQLYFDDKLIYENHSIHIYQLLDHLKKFFDENGPMGFDFGNRYIKDSWVEENDRDIPPLNEIPDEAWE